MHTLEEYFYMGVEAKKSGMRFDQLPNGQAWEYFRKGWYSANIG